MTSVYERLSFGSDETCSPLHYGSLAVVHACRTCFGRRVTDDKDTQRDRPNYLTFEDGHHLYMDLIDWPKPEFEIEIFFKFIEFVDRQIKERGVLIHCNKGESRAPSLALLYMAKRLALLPNENYDLAAECFRQQFPYSPSRGISSWLRQHWQLFDCPEEHGRQLEILYYLDRADSRVPSSRIIELAEISSEIDPNERNLFKNSFPNGLGPLGSDIALKQLDEWSLEREFVLERLRHERFTELPSRYTSILACRTSADLDQLRWLYDVHGLQGNLGRAWKIRGEIAFRGDMNIFQYHSTDLPTAAEMYWAQEDSINPIYEFLLRPPVTILEKPEDVD